VLAVGTHDRRNFISQNLSNLAWSFAVFGVLHLPLRYALSQAAIPRMTGASAQDLANTVWAVAIRCFDNVPLLQSLSSESRNQVI